uniref:Uncharacterized protein n=1 Tax=Peromyscus maniculatus bairdii TaxID=230844 RepID=A0A8C8UIW3_PERMB
MVDSITPPPSSAVSTVMGLCCQNCPSDNENHWKCEWIQTQKSPDQSFELETSRHRKVLTEILSFWPAILHTHTHQP